MTACYIHNILRDRFLEETNKCIFSISNSISNAEKSTDNLIPLEYKEDFGNTKVFIVRERFKEYFWLSVMSNKTSNYDKCTQIKLYVRFFNL